MDVERVGHKSRHARNIPFPRRCSDGCGHSPDRKSVLAAAPASGGHGCISWRTAGDESCPPADDTEQMGPTATLGWIRAQYLRGVIRFHTGSGCLHCDFFGRVLHAVGIRTRGAAARGCMACISRLWCRTVSAAPGGSRFVTGTTRATACSASECELVGQPGSALRDHGARGNWHGLCYCRRGELDGGTIFQHGLRQIILCNHVMLLFNL